MAYPEEPQRTLSAPVPSQPIPPSRGGVRRILPIFAATLVACLLLYAFLTVPGGWFPAAATKSYAARELGLTRGTGGLDRDALVVTAVDATGLALITANSDFRSVDYPVVAWSGTGFPEGADVRFLWRSDYAPGKLNSIPVTVAAGRLTPVVMSKSPDWVGRITGIALAIRVPIGEPVRVTSVDIKSGGVVAQVTDRLREWLTFEPWSGASINTITGGADVQELPLPTLVIVALAIAAAIWFAWARRAHAAASLPVALALLFVVAWVLLDAQWSFNLARQVAQTRAQYGGKDSRERHLAAEDAALYRFVEKARAKLPAEPARVFVVADAAYFRGRGAYHLYPHNVLFDPFANSVPKAASLHAGDYVVVYQRRGVQYNAEEKKLRFEGGETVSAEALVAEGGGALFKVL